MALSRLLLSAESESRLAISLVMDGRNALPVSPITRITVILDGTFYC